MKPWTRVVQESGKAGTQSSDGMKENQCVGIATECCGVEGASG